MLGIGIANSIGLNKIPSNIDPAQAFFDATGITSDVEQSAIVQLIYELQTAGLWSKMKAIYPFVTDNRNLFSYTENFANGYWTSPMTRLLNSGLAPDGTNTANALVEGNKLDTYLVSSFASINLSPGIHTVTVYAKKSTRDWLQLYMNDGTTTRFCWFNLLTGTIGTVQAGATALILDEGNGWYRCQMSMTMSSAGNNAGFGPSSGDGISNYMGNSSTGIFAWGAQLELGGESKYQPIYGTQQDYISNQFKYNLKDPRDLNAAFRLQFNGGWTYFYQGATPGGVNGYADTYFVPNTIPYPDYESFHISYYSRTNNTKMAVDMGVFNPDPFYDQTNISITYSGTTVYAVNNGSGSVATTFPTTGLFLATVDGVNRNLYRNGINISSYSGPVNIPQPRSIWIGGRNNDGEYTDRQCSFSGIGSGFNLTESVNFYNAVQNFQTALNRQV